MVSRRLGCGLSLCPHEGLNSPGISRVAGPLAELPENPLQVDSSSAGAGPAVSILSGPNAVPSFVWGPWGGLFRGCDHCGFDVEYSGASHMLSSTATTPPVQASAWLHVCRYSYIPNGSVAAPHRLVGYGVTQFFFSMSGLSGGS